MHAAPWPDGSQVEALCHLLCRPSPPLVPAAALESAGDVRALARQRARGGNRGRVSELRAAIDAWRTAGGGLVLFHDAHYPPLLRHTSRPPVALFLRGDVRALHRPMVALVGSRAASGEARSWTRDTAGDLARLGIAIASGLARGIDAAAHEGALDSGGTTIAVQGCGPDLVYPPYHAALAQRIVAQGCIATEFPPGTLPRPWHFPMRNRILAGLSQGVVVVQAEEKSGALVTARHARDENREVMAVPGDVRDPRSRGPHALLRDGAALVEGAAHVLEALGMLALPFAAVRAGERTGDDGTAGGGEEVGDGDPAGAAASAIADSAGDTRALLAALTRAQSIDTLHAQLGWTASRLQRALAALELAGLVAREPGGIWRRWRC